jgi:EAL domain-containing protein (putative c-di-GMP-specific phosphodiesterase class I)
MDSTVDGERPQVSIDEALASGWFELWYQPKIDLRQKCLAGAEAFARIRHPVHGDLGPGNFTPIVDADSIKRLTEYVLISALTNWSPFEQTGFHLHLSLNMPVRLLHQLPIDDIVDQYRPHSERWPGIILEVTEGQIAQELAFLAQMADGWRSRGIAIAIDEIDGTASFDDLSGLPIGELKLAHGVVRECTIDAGNADTCQTVIDLAHRCGGAAVAGGVETQSDLRALMAMGCDFAQGPVIAPHMCQQDFLDMLLQRVDRRGAHVPSTGYRAPDADDAVGRVA